MKSRAEQLDEMSKAILIATDRIRYYKQQDKMLQSEIKRLTRNERTHRLCTRGGMVEAFIQEPEKLTDDQVMELLTIAFRQPEVSEILQKMLEEVKAKPLPEGQGRNYTPFRCHCALRGLLQRARWRKRRFLHPGDAALPLRRCAATLLHA